MEKYNLEDLHLHSYKEVVDTLFEQLRNLKSKSIIYLGVVGGNSVIPLYKQMVKQAEELNKEVWDKIVWCFADERLVPLESDESNYSTIYTTLFKPLLNKRIIQQNNIYPIPTHIENAWIKYSKTIPQVDILILSAGEDGHIASLFPNHSSILDDSRGFIKVENAPKLPHERITASKVLLQQAKCGFLLFSGENKNQAYNDFFNTSLSLEQCPAKLIQYLPKKYIMRI